MKKTMNKYFKNTSVVLRVFSVVLCVTKINYTENHREDTENHRGLFIDNSKKVGIQIIKSTNKK